MTSPEAQAADLAEAERLAGLHEKTGKGNPCDFIWHNGRKFCNCQRRDRVAAIAAALEKARGQGRHQGQLEVVQCQEAAMEEARRTRRPISDVLRDRLREAQDRARGSDAAPQQEAKP